jgi:hypothetical protein
LILVLVLVMELVLLSARRHCRYHTTVRVNLVLRPTRCIQPRRCRTPTRSHRKNSLAANIHSCLATVGVGGRDATVGVGGSDATVPVDIARGWRRRLLLLLLLLLIRKFDAAPISTPAQLFVAECLCLLLAATAGPVMMRLLRLVLELALRRRGD